jgi:FimV-like protein
MTVKFPNLLIWLMLSTAVAADSYGPVKPGDMLWNIAAKFNLEAEISRHQIMLALLENNPDAFALPCNMNSLKVGHVLDLPSLEIVQQYSANQAANIVSQQADAWKNRRVNAIICPPVEEVQEVAVVEEIEEIKEIKEIEEIKEVTKVAEKEPDRSAKFILPEPEPPKIKPELNLVNLEQIWPIAVLLCLGLILLWRLLRRSSKHRGNPQRQETQSELHATIFSRDYGNPKQTPINAVEHEVKDKLAIIRTCLAGGEEAVQVLLNDVLHKGSTEQQLEAQQLLEINRKLHQLEQQQVTLANCNYLPEQKEQVFELIDKIFVLLDKELNANGQLIQAYNQKISGKTSLKAEKTFVESQPTAKTTRYL